MTDLERTAFRAEMERQKAHKQHIVDTEIKPRIKELQQFVIDKGHEHGFFIDYSIIHNANGEIEIGVLMSPIFG
jgi:hypothetical protein